MFEKRILVSLSIFMVCVVCFYHGDTKLKSVRGSIPSQQVEVQRMPKEEEKVGHREALNAAEPAAVSATGRSFNVAPPQWLSQSEGNGGSGNGGGDGSGFRSGSGTINVTAPNWLPGAGGNKTWNRTGSSESMPFLGHSGTHVLHNVVEGPDGVGVGCVDTSDVEFTTISCTDTPKCSKTPISVTEGYLVCRTLYNMFTGAKQTKTACVVASQALPSDVCGCCGGDCPAVCTCSCNLPNGKGGVLVHQGINGSRCAPREIAMTMIAVMKGSCVTECP